MYIYTYVYIYREREKCCNKINLHKGIALNHSMRTKKSFIQNGM